uniref:substrate-binding periplasmic protein n=2 Tax=Lactobacillales TaxID=186826 RepID=UPI00352A46D3
EGNFNLKLTGDLLYESPASFAFNKDNEDLYNKFNAALIEVKENGTLSAIYQEYFGEDYSETKTGRIRGSEGFEF